MKDSARLWPDLICLCNCLLHGKKIKGPIEKARSQLGGLPLPRSWATGERQEHHDKARNQEEEFVNRIKVGDPVWAVGTQ